MQYYYYYYYYGRLHGLILLFQNPTVSCRISSKFVDSLGTRPQEKFPSSGLADPDALEKRKILFLLLQPGFELCFIQPVEKFGISSDKSYGGLLDVMFWCLLDLVFALRTIRS